MRAWISSAHPEASSPLAGPTGAWCAAHAARERTRLAGGLARGRSLAYRLPPGSTGWTAGASSGCENPRQRIATQYRHIGPRTKTEHVGRARWLAGWRAKVQLYSRRRAHVRAVRRARTVKLAGHLHDHARQDGGGGDAAALVEHADGAHGVPARRAPIVRSLQMGTC